jgi:hypothetical protein
MVISVIRLSMKACLLLACMVLLVFAIPLCASRVNADVTAQISVNPSFSSGTINDTLTITIELKNVANLYGWQVALEYNATVANCSAAWVPDDSVFAGKNFFSIPSVVNAPTFEGLNYLLIGETLISGSVDISNGKLFEANFTIDAIGSTSVLIADRQNPVQFGGYTWEVWYSQLVDAEQQDIPFTGQSGVISNGGNIKPIALFTATTPNVDNRTYLVINGPAPTGVSSYVRGYAGMATVFNASGSYDHDGRITQYLWDFGVPGIPAVETNDPVINCTYNATGRYLVTLTVWDNGTPPLSSDKFTQYIEVDLVLQRYDWTPFLYTVFGLIIVAVVILGVRSVRKRKEKFPTPS